MPKRKKLPFKFDLKNSSGLLVILLIVLSFFTGYLFFKVQNLQPGGAVQGGPQQQVQQPAVEVKLDQVKKLFTKEYIHFGDSSRKVLFVEVSDPSCPYCHVAGGLNPELSTQVGTQFTYVSNGGTYRPAVPEMRKLVDEKKASYAMIYANGHGNGELAMQAQYCAFEKNKFWEVHDLLYSKAGYDLTNDQVKNDKTKIPELVNFLSSVFDRSFLTECLTSGKYSEILKRDVQLAPTIGFQGTPHFLMNTTQFGGAVDYSTIEPAVLEALK